MAQRAAPAGKPILDLQTCIWKRLQSSGCAAQPANFKKDHILTTEEEYRAMAAEALANIPSAKSEQERLQLRRASAAYAKLATHRIEAKARAELKPPRIFLEKQPVANPSGRSSGFTFSSK